MTNIYLRRCLFLVAAATCASAASCTKQEAITATRTAFAIGNIACKIAETQTKSDFVSFLCDEVIAKPGSRAEHRTFTVDVPKASFVRQEQPLIP